MSITFAVEAHSVAEFEALASERAPSLNVHNTGGYTLLAALGIETDYCGSVDAAELLARIDRAPLEVIPAHPGTQYVTERLPRLRDVAVAAARLGRQVAWS